MKKGKGKGGLGFLWVILLIIFLSSDALRGLIGLVLGLGLLAAAFFIIRAVIKAVKEDSISSMNTSIPDSSSKPVSALPTSAS